MKNEKRNIRAELFEVIQIISEYNYHTNSYMLEWVIKRLWEIKKEIDTQEEEKLEKILKG